MLKLKLATRVGFLAGLFLLTSFSLKADQLKGDEIVRRADQVMIGDSAEYDNTMVIKRPEVEDQTLKYTTYFKERGKKVLIQILYPPREVGKDLLLLGENMWQYVPDVDRSVRIAGSQRFMGGDFSNADLLKISLVGDYDAKLIDTRVIDQQECYYLELKGKQGATYDQVTYWVRTADFTPYREEYVTLSGKKMKALIYSEVGELGNRIRPRKLTMINYLRPDYQTIISITRAKYDLKLPDSMFTRTYLERKKR